MYLLVPFNMQNFTISLKLIQSYEKTPIWDIKWAAKWFIFPEQDFFWLTTNITLMSINFTTSTSLH